MNVFKKKKLAKSRFAQITVKTGHNIAKLEKHSFSLPTTLFFIRKYYMRLHLVQYDLSTLTSIFQNNYQKQLQKSKKE